MTEQTFGILVAIVLPGAFGFLQAFFPRVIPRMTNALWAAFGMKSRLAEEDYEKVAVRAAGGMAIAFAIFVLITAWHDLWK